MNSDDVSEEVAIHVSELRNRRGWTRRQLAEQCKTAGFPFLTFAAITYIETGRRDGAGRRRRSVSVDELVALSTVFGVDHRALTSRYVETPCLTDEEVVVISALAKRLIGFEKRRNARRS